MSVLHVNQIKAAIRSRFDGLIDLSDVPSQKPAAERETMFLTRGLAAFVLAELADIDDKVAAAAVIDGFDDNGIDAVYYNAGEKLFYIVQTKWNSSGEGSIDLGDTLKFIAGAEDLLNARFDRFNSKLRKREAEVRQALEDPSASATFKLVIAYTGAQALSPHVNEAINKFTQRMNDTTSLVSLEPMSQSQLHAAVAANALGDKVNMELMLNEWGKIAQPYLAYYGHIELAEIGSWEKHGLGLTAKNLRKFKGLTEVNESIARTISESPEHFWYFNNGITMICDRVAKKPLGGDSKASGVFVCEGASVVNGAQTVGTIIRVLKENPGSTNMGRVMVRLISLENCPPDFGKAVTRAANTQNRIEKKDFAALDPNQTRLKTEMWLEYKKEYVFQTGESTISPDSGCDFEEAAIALACSLPDVSLAVQAKREVGVLYEDITKPPYTSIFGNSTSAQKVWRAVQIKRAVDDILKSEALQHEGRDRLVAIHSNRLILHMTFRHLGVKFLSGSETELSEALSSTRSIVVQLLDATIRHISSNFANSYPANFFRTTTKCKQLVDAVLS